MDRQSLLWALVAFFGASVAFGMVRDFTADESTGVALLAQIATLVVIIAFVVLVVRIRSRRGP